MTRRPTRTRARRRSAVRKNGFAWQWLAAIDALHGRGEQARNNPIEYRKRIPGHAVSSLRPQTGNALGGSPAVNQR
jgi:hypothetical protein